jgi:hypothetical protein
VVQARGAVVDLTSARLAAMLDFEAGIEKIFEVRVNAFSRSPFFSGPYARVDGTPPIWLIPTPRFDNPIS